VLLRVSEESETRTLTIVGTAVVLCAAAAVLLIAMNPFGGRADGRISVAIDTPYVGQGVATGTALIMHGVKVGEVTGVASLHGGGVRLDADLQTKAVAALTDAVNIDFRPANYFGVTGINLIAGTGGQALRDGSRVNTVPKGNFTLQALLSRLGEVSTGAITPQLIHVIERATRYTDAMNPLIETMLTVAEAVADVQTVPLYPLLRNATGVSVALPSFVDAASDAGDYFENNGFAEVSEDVFQKRYIKTFELAATSLFGAVGRLESRYVDELLPAVNSLKAVTDVVPALIRPEDFAQTLVELRSRFEKMYAGTPEQRALQVRIVLDSLPGVAAPLGVMGGPQ
jgi:hypothetical protein